MLAYFHMKDVQHIHPVSTPIITRYNTVLHGIPGAPGIAGAPCPGYAAGYGIQWICNAGMCIHYRNYV